MNEKMSVDSRTGTVHIPTTDRCGPGHPKGSFLYRDNKLDGVSKKHMHMQPNQTENPVWIEFQLAHSFLPQARNYKLQLRFQTNHAQSQPLRMSIKRGDKDSAPVHTLDINLPNTNNKWQSLDPPITLPSNVTIGGPPDTFLHFSHPNPEGKGILIRDFSLLPLTANESGEYSATWLAEWMDTLQATVRDSLVPGLDGAGVKCFQEACKKSLEVHEKVNQIKNDDDKKVAEEELKMTHKRCLQAAMPLFNKSIDPTLGAIDFKQLKGDSPGRELLQCIVLAHGTPANLAHYASQSEKQRKRLKHFMETDEGIQLMYRMFVHGGPRGGNYGKALDIHAELEARRKQDKSVFPKLSLAVALEFAEPIQSFGQTTFIDPIERYLHYEAAYLARELEPAFESLSVWELRMAVNSDAPNDQLAWCRTMIRNYNPNIVLMDDYHWRYAWIVRTDVTYNEPVWTRSQRDYRQILSGGGMCGPRAWMGRFACKAFGNPTWGVRQPGHAALTRWTPSGWVTALGGGFRVSYWEDRDGLDFECETKIRHSLGDEAYFQKVALIDWIAMIVGERQKVSYITDKVWPSLAIVQRQRLSKVELKTKQFGQCEILPLITEVKQRKDTKESITNRKDGSIVVPVISRASVEGVHNFNQSFDSGHQVFLKSPGWSLTFRLSQKRMPEKKTFKISLRYVNVHENAEKPVVVSVADGKDGKNAREYNIPLPYTNGMWKETEPIDILLGGVDETIKLSRKGIRFPCALKEFTLTPC